MSIWPSPWLVELQGDNTVPQGGTAAYDWGIWVQKPETISTPTPHCLMGVWETSLGQLTLVGCGILPSSLWLSEVGVCVYECVGIFHHVLRMRVQLIWNPQAGGLAVKYRHEVILCLAHSVFNTRIFQAKVWIFLFCFWKVRQQWAFPHTSSWLA